MLISAVAAGLVSGIALRGDPRRLAALRPRWWGLLAVGVALRLVAALPPLGVDAQHVLYVAALWAIVAVAARNLALSGAPFVAAGVGLNALVVTASGGAMPVSVDAVARAGGRLPTDALHVVSDGAFPLGDVIPVALAGAAYSVGDVLLAIGTFVLIVGTMRTRAANAR